MPKSNRKRQKMECQECGKIVNCDYKKCHIENVHKDLVGKNIHVPFTVPGAPENPFKVSYIYHWY